MKVEKTRQQALLSWLFVGMLLALSTTLGVLQYRWIGEVSRAEGERLRGSLQASLRRLSQDFNAEITAACVALLPNGFSLEDGASREEAYALRYARWKESGHHDRLFRRISIAVPQDGLLVLRDLDLVKGAFKPGEWPPEWSALRQRLAARLSGNLAEARRVFGPLSAGELALIELPRFAPPESRNFSWRERPTVREWLILELDLDYLRAAVFPELLGRHLGGGAELDYQAEIVGRDNSAVVIYRSEPDGKPIGAQADASVSLFELQWDQFFRRRGLPRSPGPPEPRTDAPAAGSGEGPPPRIPSPDRGRWLLSVRHRAGSLEAVVSMARRRNVAVTTAILLLMVAAAAALVRFSRQAQRLAQMQMEFVAGVSHEFRTPLSVIRTAAYNLRSGVVSGAKQVQRYGALIHEEGEKLSAIVEQVLQFARARADSAGRASEPVSVEAIIDDTLESVRGLLEESGCTVEQKIEPGLPLVLGDPTALRHVLRNLLSNAAKHGSDGHWIGVFASLSGNGKQPFVEIRVADRGPGIPPDELGQIFDPFFRGKRAMERQIHGTGLGLSLVKRIVEAHGGTVAVRSEPGQGTEFAVRLPPAPPEQQDEFTHSFDRG